MVASDGLAPARCEGLLTSLFAPRPAAPGAGQECTSAAVERSFADAVRGRHEMYGQVSDCGGRQARATWRGIDERGIALRTLAPGSVASVGGATRLRAVRRQPGRLPQLAGVGGYEEVRRHVCAAFDGVDAATKRLTAVARDKYSLVYDVMHLAPNFGRSRGQLRGAAGGFLSLGAGRTRVNLAEAKIAVMSARCAWRASERVLVGLMAECARVERGAQAIQSKHMQLLRARRREMSAGVHGRGMGERQVQWSEKLTIDVGRIHARSMARLAAARIELDRYYWGVWGSARRCKASTREVQALMVALREAEHGDWYGDLPGGSTWWDAAAAAMENAGQLGGECAQTAHTDAGGAFCSIGCTVVGNDGGGGDEGDGEAECGHGGGRQAAGGGHADCGRRGIDGGRESWGLQHRQGGSLQSDETRWWRLAVLQAMIRLRGEELKEGDVGGLAERTRHPTRARKWWAWRYRWRWKLWAGEARAEGRWDAVGHY